MAKEERTIAYYKWLQKQRREKRWKKKVRHRKRKVWAKANPPSEVQIYDLFEVGEIP